MSTLLYWLKKLLPRPLVRLLRPPYHWLWAWVSHLRYGNASQHLTVIGVTGTKGKSTVTELIAAILRANGHSVASLSTIQFTYGAETERNLYKMTQPGRWFTQRFFHTAVAKGCTHAVVELTSEGVLQSRHRFIELDALVFTNLTPEHIESHGSFAKYKAAKLEIAHQLERSKKRPRYIVANADSEHGADFLRAAVEHQLPYSLTDLKLYTLQRDGVSLIFTDGDEERTIRVPLIGKFNVANALAAITLTQALGVSLPTIEKALRDLPPIHGRVEPFSADLPDGRHVTAIVDYAHTPDSLTQLYEAFKDYPIVGVLGNTGGGRDTWKRPEMGAIAERYCQEIILTNEDPYDENPRQIVEAMRAGMSDDANAEIIMDRRTAIATALERCPAGGYVLVSGKGTDPYIMGPHNTKEPWSDAAVVTAELTRLAAGG
ncbi:MAG TPA: UDP-N-acetylmuramyl-tripeptide synthetase [Candidatus Paceibacterota bacterium]|nr:UDP-N-acetylmuramyl-tripeptide synthetase [Candidatus Paceibacterota bacterium]